MFSDATQEAIAESPPPTIHEATRGTDLSGVVYWSAEIGVAAGVAMRQAGHDIVIRGHDLAANRALAQSIEASVGSYRRGQPHKHTAGPLALPHFQQALTPPEGHTFYEIEHRKARKKP